MPISLPDYGNLIEVISDMSFRNEAHIKIAKSKREIAYSMSLDIAIDSIDFSLYENGKSSPPIQFYGYVELVFQDSLSLEFPIHFPRQRIYQVYQWEAFRQWQEYVPFIAARQYHRNTVLQIEAIKGALNIPATVEVEAELWETKWVELPLREIHVKMQSNCQFLLSYAQVQPVPFNDPLSPVPKQRSGKSNQEDGAKDKGLPSNGIQPRRNPLSNPFSGNNPVSSSSDLLSDGFSPLSSSNLTAPNIDSDGSLGYFVKVVWTNRQSSSPYNCRIVTFTFYRLVASGTSSASAVNTGLTETGCGSTVSVYDLITNTGQVVTRVGAISLSATVVRAASLPPDEPEVIS